MERESGSKHSPIWLIGDSPPIAWEDRLSIPLDPRHPSRHSIWTPIVDGIQDRVFRGERLRVDTSRLYVRNAIQDASRKEAIRGKGWGELEAETSELRGLLEEHRPVLVFTFGSFAFEFVNRSLGGSQRRAWEGWNVKLLGEQFRQSVAEFALDQVNVFPLLHSSISRGRFLEAHSGFTRSEGGNYFDYVADEIADLLLEHKDALQVWVK